MKRYWQANGHYWFCPMTTYLRGVAIKALLIVTASLSAIVVGEIVLRYLQPYPGKYLTWPPHLRKDFRPSPTYISGVGAYARYRINAQGIRGDELSDEQGYRVLTLGGSTTECLYQDQERTWSALLQGHLRRVKPDRKPWVGILGRSGFNTRHHVVQMRYEVPQLPRMDTITFLIGCNDLALRLIRGDAYDPNCLLTGYGEQHQIRRTFLFYPLGMGFVRDYKDTAWWRLVRSLRNKSSCQLALDDYGASIARLRERRCKADNILDQLPDMKPALDEYARNVTTIIDLGRKLSNRMVFLTQPSLWRTDLSADEKALLWSGVAGDLDSPEGRSYYAVEALSKGMELYNNRLKEVCAQREIECLDLAAQIPKDSRYFFDDVHFTDQGSRLVADRVAAYLDGTNSRETTSRASGNAGRIPGRE